jgi:V/A-type H+-transporting ATPase subunit I
VVRLTGNEAVSEVFFLRPIENINTILVASIAIGIFLLLVSFGYSIYNKLKIKDLKEGVFGRNGVAGLVLYLSVLGIAASKLHDQFAGYAGILTLLAVTSVGLIIVREPLANAVRGHRPLYHETAGAYYVESGFDILETFLSMLSNSVSFIRVGAFALNHVGLFVAFHTMASIIGTLAGDVSMFIIGNVIIICLEGLIVFIQGLRLVYYELFSKYYTGEGVPFSPAAVQMDQ